MLRSQSAIIRPWQQTDVSVVYELAKANMPGAWTRRNFESCFKPDYSCWIISEGDMGLANQVMGFVVVLAQIGECQLLNICIRGNARRCGYGKRLIQHVVSFSRQQKLNRVFLEVRASNQVAIDFYLQSDFKQVGARKAYYKTEDGREDALLFSLSL